MCYVLCIMYRSESILDSQLKAMILSWIYTNETQFEGIDSEDGIMSTRSSRKNVVPMLKWADLVQV